jgi:RNA polymerase sigma-B factor
MTRTITTSARLRRDQITQQHLSVADAIAAEFSRRYRGLVDHEDIRQEARLALVSAADRVTEPSTAAAFLRACIKGHLAHYLRDRVRLVRVSRRAHETGREPLGHSSLDAVSPGTGRPYLEQLAAPAEQQEGRVHQLSELLDRLPAGEAAVLRLRYLQGLTVREAAAALAVSHATAHRMEQRAIGAARQLVEA